MREFKNVITKNVIQTTVIATPLGDMMAAALKDGICMCAFMNMFHIEAHLAKLKEKFDAEVISSENEYFYKLRIELQEYFKGTRKSFSLPLKLVGTPFQIRVWKELLQIPYGTTISYKTQATNINQPKAYRAVANANGQNMLNILIPCHRVISNDGKLSGYGAGVQKKEFLLGLEGVVIANKMFNNFKTSKD